MLSIKEISDGLKTIQAKYHSKASLIAKDCQVSPTLISFLLNDKLDFNITEATQQRLSDWVIERKWW